MNVFWSSGGISKAIAPPEVRGKSCQVQVLPRLSEKTKPRDDTAVIRSPFGEILTDCMGSEASESSGSPDQVAHRSADISKPCSVDAYQYFEPKARSETTSRSACEPSADFAERLLRFLVGCGSAAYPAPITATPVARDPVCSQTFFTMS